jgi:hypothetical protein
MITASRVFGAVDNAILACRIAVAIGFVTAQPLVLTFFIALSIFLGLDKPVRGRRLAYILLLKHLCLRRGNNGNNA